AACETRIVAVVEIARGAVELKLPVLAAEVAISVAVAKLSVEYSSLLLGTEPVFVQVIDWVVPTAQTSPPLGAVTAKPPLILKVASETSFVPGSFVSETRILTVAEMSFGTSQL